MDRAPYAPLCHASRLTLSKRDPRGHRLRVLAPQSDHVHPLCRSRILLLVREMDVPPSEPIANGPLPPLTPDPPSGAPRPDPPPGVRRPRSATEGATPGSAAMGSMPRIRHRGNAPWSAPGEEDATGDKRMPGGERRTPLCAPLCTEREATL